VIEALKSGFEEIEHLEGSKRILQQTFGEGAGSNLSMSRLKPIGLTLVHRTNAQYAKFTAAASGAGIGQSAQRQIFEAFAEAARVKNLTGDQTTSIFQALDKIFAKDTVGATELFRKLSTDLPEAAAIFRKSIDTLDGQPLTTDEFDRLLKSGKITAAFVQKFAADCANLSQSSCPRRPIDERCANRFNNTWDDFKISILNGGRSTGLKRSRRLNRILSQCGWSEVRRRSGRRRKTDCTSVRSGDRQYRSTQDGPRHSGGNLGAELR